MLVINAGSSSLKVKIIDTYSKKSLLKGVFEKIGCENSVITWKNENGEVVNQKVCNLYDHKKAFFELKNYFSTGDILKGICRVDDISSVVHRVVHGGKYFKEATLIDNDVINKIKSLSNLAPLHNKPSLVMINLFSEFFKKEIPQIAVFDTSFYINMPKKAYTYGIPKVYLEKYDIRKYGFHGLSHKFVSIECAKMMNKSLDCLKIISCHLGSGSSVTAINEGFAVDTSMGFTPLDGVIMGTRCGSLDPSVVTFLQEKENLSFSDINDLLNKKSGFLGVSGVSADYRDLTKSAQSGDKNAFLAQEIMDYQVIKYIGAFTAAMNGCDAIVFTAGIGSNQYIHRGNICKNLSFLGVKIDEKLNKEKILGNMGEISTEDSKIKVFVVETNEELMMALDAQKCLSENLNKEDK